VGVFELDVFVTHEGPGRETRPVEGEGAAEVLNGLFVEGQEGVVVSDDDAGFGAELVYVGA
jgi:hypothetical protein